MNSGNGVGVGAGLLGRVALFVDRPHGKLRRRPPSNFFHNHVRPSTPGRPQASTRPRHRRPLARAASEFEFRASQVPPPPVPHRAGRCATTMWLRDGVSTLHPPPRPFRLPRDHLARTPLAFRRPDCSSTHGEPASPLSPLSPLPRFPCLARGRSSRRLCPPTTTPAAWWWWPR